MSDSLIALSNFMNKRDTRDFTSKLIDVAGYLGACNGHLLIVDSTINNKNNGLLDFYKQRIKNTTDYNLHRQLEGVEKRLNHYSWSDLPVIDNDLYQQCYCCNGRGKVRKKQYSCECLSSEKVRREGDYNKYPDGSQFCVDNDSTDDFVTCFQCKGSKKNITYASVLAANDKWVLNGEYVLLLCDLPDIKISWQEHHELCLFKFTGGFGVIMPMHP